MTSAAQQTMDTPAAPSAAAVDENPPHNRPHPPLETSPSPEASPLQLVRDVIVGRLTHGLIRATLSDSKESLLIQPSGGVAPEYLPRMHAHDNYALCWVIVGRCIVEVPHRWVLVDPQNALLLQTGEEHRIRPTPQLEPFEMCSWNLSRGGIRLVRDTFASPRRERVESFVPMAVPVMPLVERVARELQVRRPHYDLFVCTALLEIAAHILRSHAEDANRSRTGGAGSSSEGVSRYVEAVIRYVDVSHGQHLTLRQLASTIGLSPSYLTSLFRRYTGRSVMAHIADVRHQEARSLLRTTDLDVVEIAQAVGYDDPHYFGRTFKAREGCSPGQYRRLLRLAQWASPEGTGTADLLKPRG